MALTWEDFQTFSDVEEETAISISEIAKNGEPQDVDLAPTEEHDRVRQEAPDIEVPQAGESQSDFIDRLASGVDRGRKLARMARKLDKITKALCLKAMDTGKPSILVGKHRIVAIKPVYSQWLAIGDMLDKVEGLSPQAQSKVRQMFIGSGKVRMEVEAWQDFLDDADPVNKEILDVLQAHLSDPEGSIRVATFSATERDEADKFIHSGDAK